MKNQITLPIIISIFFLLILACGDGKKASDNSVVSTATNSTGANKSTATQKAEDKPMAVTSKDLVKSYKENEVAADGKYKDKTLAVTGKISNIAETFGTYSVQLEGVDIIVSVQCTFADSEKDAIAKLKKGQTTTLIGKGDGMTAGLYVGLTDCKIQ
jgi:tRNA_anti-like